MQFDYQKTIKKIVSFSPRQGAGETKTAEYIIDQLKKYGIDYQVQGYSVQIPLFGQAYLKCDGEEIPCLPNGFSGGRISGKDNLVSSLSACSFSKDESNINYNPYSDSIGLCSFYQGPALAVSRKSVPKILKALKIEGEMTVNKVRHKAQNILVGNLKNPRIIVFSHYDSILRGAIDNASGIALALGAILKKQANLEKVLYVLAANEELSFDWPYYWGRGYREFEKKYGLQLAKTEKILALDCVGNGKTAVIKHKKMIIEALPLKNVEMLHRKISIISGNYEHLMTLYHSKNDDGRGIEDKYLLDAERFLAKEIK